jgi:hypothetical protein
MQNRDQQQIAARSTIIISEADLYRTRLEVESKKGRKKGPNLAIPALKSPFVRNSRRQKRPNPHTRPSRVSLFPHHTPPGRRRRGSAAERFSRPCKWETDIETERQRDKGVISVPRIGEPIPSLPPPLVTNLESLPPSHTLTEATGQT